LAARTESEIAAVAAAVAKCRAILSGPLPPPETVKPDRERELTLAIYRRQAASADREWRAKGETKLQEMGETT
jgi:hypothetical protein